MAVFVDTSILLRLANRADAKHSLAENAVFKLHQRGEVVNITAQNLVEFRNAATRPLSVNGLGLVPNAVELIADSFERSFGLLPETPAIYPAWKSLVSQLGVIGKLVHDARLVAVCQVHGIDKILTFNISHFQRLVAGAPGIVVVDPATV